MLNGLEVTVLRFSEMDLGSRIDAEYFSKENLTVQNTLKLKQSKKFAEYGKFVSSAFYPAATHLYETGIVPFIRCVDCVNYPVISKLQDESFERIPLEFLEEHDSVHKLEKGEIVITKVGTPCYASIVHEHDFVALSRTVFGVKEIKGIDPYYLVAFLRSRYGFQQLQREREQTIQFQLTLDRVRDILVFEPSKEFQKEVGKTLKLSFAKLEQSKRLYAEAEEILLEELGLKNFDLRNSLFNVRKFSDVQVSDRLDSEHFNKKYDRLENKLKAYSAGFETIGNLCLPPINGAEVREYVEQGTPYLRVGDLRHLDISEDTVVYIDDKAADDVREKVSLQEGDVLISRSGSLGISGVVSKKWENSITSSHLIRLRLKDKTLDPYYLALFMNTTAGVEQVRKRSNGGIQPEINQPSLKNIIVPLLSKKVQTKIRSLILRSQETREESKRLLELSKQAVESAIEKGESTAIKYLKQQL